MLKTGKPPSRSIWEAYSARGSRACSARVYTRQTVRVWPEQRPRPKRTIPDVDLILGVYNQPHLAAACIESVLRNTKYPRWRLLIVDDHSDENNRTCWSNMRRDAQICQSTGMNKTWASLARTIAGVALASAKYLVLMNSDIVVPPGWLARLVEVAEANPACLGQPAF